MISDFKIKNINIYEKNHTTVQAEQTVKTGNQMKFVIHLPTSRRCRQIDSYRVPAAIIQFHRK